MRKDVRKIVRKRTVYGECVQKLSETWVVVCIKAVVCWYMLLIGVGVCVCGCVCACVAVLCIYVIVSLSSPSHCGSLTSLIQWHTFLSVWFWCSLPLPCTIYTVVYDIEDFRLLFRLFFSLLAAAAFIFLEVFYISIHNA